MFSSNNAAAAYQRNLVATAGVHKSLMCLTYQIADEATIGAAPVEIGRQMEKIYP